MSGYQKESRATGVSGLVFVGCLILSVAIGLLIGNITVSILAGLGIGFIAMGIVRFATGSW